MQFTDGKFREVEKILAGRSEVKRYYVAVGGFGGGEVNSGVVFVTLEDETGTLNLIVWSSLVETQRKELLGARLLGVVGNVQREGPVVHFIAERLEDHSALLGRLPSHQRRLVSNHSFSAIEW